MRKLKMPRLIIFAILSMPMVVISFLSVWQRNEMIRIGYETEILHKKKNALLRHQKELRVEVERLSALGRIEQIALEQLGMKQPNREQRVFITAQALENRFNED